MSRCFIDLLRTNFLKNSILNPVRSGRLDAYHCAYIDVSQHFKWQSLIYTHASFHMTTPQCHISRKYYYCLFYVWSNHIQYMIIQLLFWYSFYFCLFIPLFLDYSNSSLLCRNTSLFLLCYYVSDRSFSPQSVFWIPLYFPS